MTYKVFNDWNDVFLDQSFHVAFNKYVYATGADNFDLSSYDFKSATGQFAPVTFPMIFMTEEGYNKFLIAWG